MMSISPEDGPVQLAGLCALKFLMATVPFAAQTFAMQNPDAQLSLENCCPIVELRQYTLHPGKRDVLIDLFDREFVESQEALGMKVIGQFRDLDNPNRFVWLRGLRAPEILKLSPTTRSLL